jgi:hypothetical protein
MYRLDLRGWTPRAPVKLELILQRCSHGLMSEGISGVEKVLEKLATSEKTTIVFAREQDGKMRVTSGSWDGEKVIQKGEVLEVRNVDGRLHVARKVRKPDEWDPPTIHTDQGSPSPMTLSSRTGPSSMMPVKPAERPRWRRNAMAYRKRRRHGLFLRPIRVTREQLDSLEVMGYLDPDCRGRRADEVDAIERYFSDTFRGSAGYRAARNGNQSWHDALWRCSSLAITIRFLSQIPG